MLKLIGIWLSAVTASCSLQAQTNMNEGPLPAHSNMQELYVGDKLPDINIGHVINYPTEKIKLSDFRGKLLLLDFMSTGCKSCIEKLPEYDSLQKMYSDKIQILLIVSSKQDYVKHVWKRNKFLQQISLPVVTEDTLLFRLFPHQVISHLVWIDTGGMVKAITTPQYVNKENIKAVLANKRISWPVKKDILDFDRRVPLLQLYGNRPEFYATFTRHINGIPGVQAGFMTDSSKGITRCFAFNKEILQLYWMTIGKGELENNIPDYKLTKLEISDSSKFFYDADKSYRDIWRSNNTYCYESVQPFTTPRQEVLQAMRTDLNRFLNLNGRIEKIKTRTIVITREIKDETLLRASGGKKIVRMHNAAPDKYLRNAAIVDVLVVLNRQKGLLPVIDETGYVGKLDIELGNIDLSDFESLREAFKRYGLNLSIEERDLNHLVITGPGYYSEKPI